ncbi:hypothetical protein [Rhodonellum sp.]|uniref:hypothetical protein n=1 Tax=Rhodonellum sp. TaxID=2231180 RepID=UPI0027156496|nr:hypothetical protein [Rhodonellum sp.]MDO9553114.1 hypothetical protein [Rhodonellum sp.]
MINSYSSILNRSIYIFSIIFLICISFFGFDFSDEGLYLSLSNPKQINNYSQFNYDIFFKLTHLFFDVKFGLIELRIFRISILIILFFFTIKLIKKVENFQISTFILFLGFFSSYSHFKQTLSYNIIVLFIGILYSILIFKRFYFQSKNTSDYFLLGFLSSICFTVKSTSGLILFCLVFLLIFSEKSSVSNFLKNISYLIFSFSSIQFFLYLYGVNFFEIIINGFELSQYDNTHNFVSLIRTPLAALKWIIVLIISGYVLKKSFFEYKLTLKLIYTLTSISLLLYFFISHTKLDFIKFFEYLPLILVYFLIGICFEKKLFNLEKRKFYICILFLLFPLVLLFGSNTYFFITGSVYLLFPLVAFYFLKFNLTCLRLIGLQKLIFILLVASIFIKILFNLVLYPFAQPTLLSKSKKFEYYNGSKFIYLEESQAVFLENLKFKVNEKVPSDREIISLYAMSGMVTLIDRINYLNPCVWEYDQWDFYQKKAFKDDLSKNELYFLIKNSEDIKQITNWKFTKLDSVPINNNTQIYLLKGELL